MLLIFAEHYILKPSLIKKGEMTKLFGYVTRYAALIKSLMAPGCKYLACTVEYDETKHKGTELQSLSKLNFILSNSNRGNQRCTIDQWF